MGEHQRPLPRREDCLENFVQPVELAAAPLDLVVDVVGAVVERMIADLFESRDCCQDGSLAPLSCLLALSGVDDQLVEHGLVQADLFMRHGAVGELVDAVGQLGGNLRLRLGATEYEHAIECVQRRLSSPACVPGTLQLRDERCPRADQARVAEIHDRPQVTEPVLDRGSCQGEPDPG